MAKDIFDKVIFDGCRVESLAESVQDIIFKNIILMVLQKLLYLFHTSMMI